MYGFSSQQKIYAFKEILNDCVKFFFLNPILIVKIKEHEDYKNGTKYNNS